MHFQRKPSKPLNFLNTLNQTKPNKMIKVTGTIESKNGVATYHNPVINIYMASPGKYAKTLAFAQVGKIENEGQPNENFTPVEEIFRNEYELKNPTFDNVQALLHADLETAYPSLTFEII